MDLFNNMEVNLLDFLRYFSGGWPLIFSRVAPVLSGFAALRWHYESQHQHGRDLHQHFWSIVCVGGLLFFPGLILAEIWLLGTGFAVLLPGLAKWTLGGLALGVALALAWYRWLTPRLARARDRATVRSSIYDNEDIDVRRIDSYYPADPGVRDPRKYFDLAKGIYTGHGEKGPLYFRADAGEAFPHFLIAGMSGAGKGVGLGIMGAQFLARGEGVVFIDPKDDEWAPHLFFAECLRLGVPYRFVDLRSNAPPQFNLLAGCTSHELEELFEAGLDVQRRGDTADVYRGEERRYLAMLAAAAKPGDTLADLWNEHEDVLYKQAKDFANKIWEVARIPAINAGDGPDVLGDVVRQGGCLYVVGSSTSDAVRVVQRALVIRLKQICAARDRVAGDLRHIFLVLDEFASSMSLPAVLGLQQMRDKKLHLALAFQSFEDFNAPGINLNPKYITGVVHDNTPLKITYRLEQPPTQQWFAEKSGPIPVYRKMIEQRTTPGLSRVADTNQRMVQGERELFPPVILGHLKKRLAVVYGFKEALFSWFAPVPVEKTPEALRVAALPGVRASSGSLVAENPIELAPIARPGSNQDSPI